MARDRQRSRSAGFHLRNAVQVAACVQNYVLSSRVLCYRTVLLPTALESARLSEYLNKNQSINKALKLKN